MQGCKICIFVEKKNKLGVLSVEMERETQDEPEKRFVFFVQNIKLCQPRLWVRKNQWGLKIETQRDDRNSSSVPERKHDCREKRLHLEPPNAPPNPANTFAQKTYAARTNRLTLPCQSLRKEPIYTDRRKKKSSIRGKTIHLLRELSQIKSRNPTKPIHAQTTDHLRPHPRPSRVRRRFF